MGGRKYNLKEIRELNLFDLPTSDLLQIAQDCDIECIHIQSQIEQKGNRSNLAWQKKAQAAASLLSQYSRNCREIIEYRSDQDRRFVDSAYQELDSELIDKIEKNKAPPE